MEQLGYIRKTFNNTAEVEVRRISGCGGGCSSCGGSCSAPNIVVKLENHIGAKVGDFVEIKAKPQKIIKYALIVYMIPFVMLISGIVLGVNLFQSMDIDYYEMLGFLVGIVFLVVSFFVVKKIDKSIRKKNEKVMEMIRILE